MSATISIPPDGQGFVNAQAIAKFYSVSKPIVYRWAAEGKIPCCRFAGTVRFDLAAVRAIVEGGSSHESPGR